jgi:tyrosine decarboxylase / aspartate 1-decarboxylase
MAISQNQKQQHILKELEMLQKKDFSFTNGRILGSMCAKPHPIAIQAYQQFLETNLGDPELFPGTKQIEQKLINFIKKMLYAPKTAKGHIISGGTEANITAMWIAKQLSGKKTILLPQSAHFSFQKIASLMDMKLVSIPLTKNYTMDTTALQKYITNDTAAIIGIAGSTELGSIDPIPHLSQICLDEHIFLHIDAAFGGFVIPFLSKKSNTFTEFRFNLPGVSSISVDAHKMGYSVISLGCLLLQKQKWLSHISVDSPYISVKKQTGLLGTRSGAPVAAAYAVAKYLGMKGYKQVVTHCMNTTQYTLKRLTEIGLEVLLPPTMNVLAVKLKKPAEITKLLSSYGWRVNTMSNLCCIRLVLMPHITTDIIDEFIPILKQVCQKTGEL